MKVRRSLDFFLILATNKISAPCGTTELPCTRSIQNQLYDPSQIWCNRQAADKMWNEHEGLPTVAFKYHEYVHLSICSIPWSSICLEYFKKRCSPPNPKGIVFLHFTYQKSELVKALLIAAVMLHSVTDFCKKVFWLVCASHDWPQHLLAMEESLDRK